MEIIIIAALDQSYGIGFQGRIPWRIPADLTRFRELTVGHPVVMGRKTYESIPTKFRPLPGRLNVVLSSDPKFDHEGIVVAHSLDEAVSSLSEGRITAQVVDFQSTYIIGGSQVYSSALPLATRLELTWVDGVFNVDTFFPRFNQREWQEVARQNHRGYSFVSYERVR